MSKITNHKRLFILQAKIKDAAYAGCAFEPDIAAMDLYCFFAYGQSHSSAGIRAVLAVQPFERKEYAIAILLGYTDAIVFDCKHMALFGMRI